MLLAVIRFLGLPSATHKAQAPGVIPQDWQRVFNRLSSGLFTLIFTELNNTINNPFKYKIKEIKRTT